MQKELPSSLLSNYDEIWISPSKNQDGSMPIGNGEIGLNVWVDQRGRLYVLIARTDAWDEIGRLCKIGRICLEFSPPIADIFSNLFPRAFRFKQRLNLLEGCLEITTKRKGLETHIRIWVDAFNPVVHIEVDASQPIGVGLKNEVWRTTQRTITPAEEAFLIEGSPNKQVYPDTILSASDGLQPNQLGWFHANPASIWESVLTHQGLGEFIKDGHDPLRHRIFGGLLQGNDMTAKSPTELESTGTHTHYHFYLIPNTEDPSQPKDWLSNAQATLAKICQEPVAKLFENHKQWWAAFWDRSWLFASGTPEAEVLTRGYILQRWIAACGGRGNFPIKFNGSIFTVNTERKYDPDYRRWGGMYWFQNTRLPYWAMLMSGDFDLFRPFIKMYTDLIPLVKHRTQVYSKHGGWFMPETMPFWGTYGDTCFGVERGALSPGEPIENRYIRYHYNSTLEFLAMLLNYYDYTQNQEMWTKILLPVAEDVLEWWGMRWSRDSKGKIVMNPANSVETYWDCINPTPDLAGLQWTIDKLLAYPEKNVPGPLRDKWAEVRHAIPDIPITQRDGNTVIFPAYEPLPNRTNCENPELYTVFPYPLFGLTKPRLEMAQTTFRKRIQYNHMGWSQDEIQAALLGLTEEATTMIVKRAHMKHKGSRFPAFWGPNFDWIPDQDHGSNLLTAFQRMVAQGVEDKILLLPAWPKSWKITFKLHLPFQTRIFGEYDGTGLNYDVDPPARKKNVVVILK
jgi:hypothetical protein